MVLVTVAIIFGSELLRNVRSRVQIDGQPATMDYGKYQPRALVTHHATGIGRLQRTLVTILVLPRMSGFYADLADTRPKFLYPRVRQPVMHDVELGMHNYR